MNGSCFHRITVIHNMIKNNGYPNPVMLAEKFKVSKRTIEHDMSFMREQLGAPVEFDRKKKGYYYNQDYKIKEITDAQELLNRDFTSHKTNYFKSNNLDIKYKYIEKIETRRLLDILQYIAIRADKIEFNSKTYKMLERKIEAIKNEILRRTKESL